VLNKIKQSVDYWILTDFVTHLKAAQWLSG